MASAAKMTEMLPDTLPEDFGEWDDERSPSAQQVRAAGSAYSPGVGVFPQFSARPAKPNGVLAAPPNLLHVTSSPAFQFSRADLAWTVEVRPAWKKWPIFAGASTALVVILAAAMIPMMHRDEASQVNGSAASAHTEAATQQPVDAMPESSLSTATVPAPIHPVSIQPAAAARSAQESPDTAAASNHESADPAQAQMMNAQLNAPSRIHMAAAPEEQSPPPSGGLIAADMAESGNKNAMGSVFGGARQPTVQAGSPKVVNVSAGVAFGLLIRKTPPVYPQVAKDSHVSGTVVLQAHISKSGTIEDLRVVSGPEMLQQAAANAVRTWRFKPYMIHSQPAEIETTISVAFSPAD
jgi:TonB family protein